jgi:hypothetical protein
MEMILKVDEVKTITVWALPSSEGKFFDELIGVIKNNPIPEIF